MFPELLLLLGYVILFLLELFSAKISQYMKLRIFQQDNMINFKIKTKKFKRYFEPLSNLNMKSNCILMCYSQLSD